MKSITFNLPEELHAALLIKQSEMHIDSGKKYPMRIIVPKLLAKALGIRLPAGWEETTGKKAKKEENSNV